MHGERDGVMFDQSTFMGQAEEDSEGRRTREKMFGIEVD